MSGTGISAVYESGIPATPRGTITSTGTIGTMMIDTQ